MVDLGSDRIKCYGDTINVIAKSDYYKYEWNGVDMGQQNFMEIQSQEDYTVTLKVTSKDGCSASDTMNVVVKPLPTLLLSPNLLVCPGTVSELTVNTSASIVEWSTGDSTTNINVLNGVYKVKVIGDNGCSNKGKVQVDWRLPPKPSLGQAEMICPNSTLLLDAGGGFVSYRWHNNEPTQSIIASIADTLNVVYVKDEFGCEGWDSKMVYHFILPSYYMGADTAICDGDELMLDAGDEYPYFLWDDGSVNQYRVVEQEGDYWVEVSDGCVWARDTINVGFLPQPYIAMIDTMIYAQISVLADGGVKPYVYSLNGEEFQMSNVFKYLVNGVYEVMIQDSNGCLATDTVEINSIVDIDIPVFLTPNGDGINDYWRISGIERFPDAEIYIFDRYGKLLVTLKGDSQGWDGRYMGKLVPSDDYWFVVYLVHVKKTIKGNITLKR